MEKPIELFLITGFLGAGKTTFLKGILEERGDRKVGLLVNEFGSVGIDGTLISGNGIRMTEISSGCIFCSCLKQGFVKTLLSFSAMDIDFLFIESSGMADPSNIHRLLDGLGSLAVRPFRYRGAVVLVDPLTFPKYVKILNPVRNQVAAGRFILINKTDLADRADIEETESIVREIQPGAFLYETKFGKIPQKFLEEKTEDCRFSKESTNTPGNRLITYSLESSEAVNRESVSEFFEAVRPYLLRLKGFVRETEGWIHADYASGIFTQEPMKDEEAGELIKTRIVMIGKDSEEFEDIVRREWQRTCGTEMELFQ